MLEFIVAIGFGCAVFLIFMLVFLRKDAQGKRGARLAGCGHHGSEDQCDRCRDAAPLAIQRHMPDSGKGFPYER